MLSVSHSSLLNVHESQGNRSKHRTNRFNFSQAARVGAAMCRQASFAAYWTSAGASGQRPEEPSVVGTELLVPVRVAHVLHRLLDRGLLQPVGVREQPSALHELMDVLRVGLVRDLIVLPTEPSVEDRHLALVSPLATRDPFGL